MRIFYSAIFIVLLFGSIQLTQAQEKPLSQAEYVQLLYQLQQNPNKKDEVVETVRRRGISFALTDGLRELTLSKSRSDEALKRTLEEANRRRLNPTASQPPSMAEAKEIWAKAAVEAGKAKEEMPDFIAKQTVSRSTAYAGTNNFVSLDKLLVAVRYSAEKGEQYQVLRINGLATNAEEGSNYGGLEGSTTSGEFIHILTGIFKEETKATFKPIDTDVLLGQPCVVFEFDIKAANDDYVIGAKRTIDAMAKVGKRGKIWITKKDFKVLRIDYAATEIPPGFPIKVFTKKIDYNWVEINKVRYLLPYSTDARFTYSYGLQLFEDRNLINFRNYNKFDVDIKVLDDDEPAEEEKPAEKKP